MKTLKQTTAGMLVLLSADELATARLIFDEEKSTRAIPSPQKTAAKGSRFDGPNATRPPFLRITAETKTRTVHARNTDMEIPADCVTMDEAGAMVDRTPTAVLRQFPLLKVRRVRYASGDDGLRVVNVKDLEKYAARMGWPFKKK